MSVTTDAYHVSTTPGADLVRAEGLVAFDWRPAPGASYDAVDLDGTETFGTSTSSGRVVFEDASAAAAFSAVPDGFTFRFSPGDGQVFSQADWLDTPAWHWDPASGLLDPARTSTPYGFEGRDWLADRAVEYAALGGDSWSATHLGRWVLHDAPLAIDVAAGDGADTVLGGLASDTVRGEGGADWLSGGAASDRLLGGSSADTLEGGAGGDRLDGQRGDDLILAGDGSDVASGGSGDDTLRGGAGLDILYGHEGADELEGGAGADTLVGGADLARLWGNDTVAYRASPEGVQVDLATHAGHGGDAEGDRYVFIRNAIGSALDDLLRGSAAPNLLEGGDGADTLVGGAGADTLAGGADADRFLLNVPGEADTITDFHPAEGDRLVLGAALQARYALEDAQGANCDVRIIASDGSLPVVAHLLGTSAVELQQAEWWILG